MNQSIISRRDFMLAASAAFLAGKKKVLIEKRHKKISGLELLVKVLGTAQDGGLPQAACYCPHCLKARQDKSFRRLVASIALINQKSKKLYLIDATPDIRQQLDILYFAGWLKGERGKNPVDAILLTHGHMGHYSGLLHLGREAAGTKDLAVYCSNSMADFLKTNAPWNLMLKLNNIRLNRFKAGEIIKLDEEVSFRGIKVPHRAEFTDTMAFEILGPKGSLLYLPDIDRWEPVEKKMKEILSRVDYALLDGTFFSADELPGRDITQIPHPLITHTMNLFEDLVNEGKCSIYFTHFNHTNRLLDDGEAMAQLQKRGFKVAEEGMDFRL